MRLHTPVLVLVVVSCGVQGFFFPLKKLEVPISVPRLQQAAYPEVVGAPWLQGWFPVPIPTSRPLPVSSHVHQNYPSWFANLFSAPTQRHPYQAAATAPTDITDNAQIIVGQPYVYPL